MKSQRGSLLGYVVVLLVILSIGTMFFFDKIAINNKGFSRVYSKSKTSLEAEGVLRSMVKITEKYLEQNFTITNVGLAAALTTNMPSITPPGYSVSNWTSSVGASSYLGTIPGGPFIGMQAELRDVSFSVDLKEIATGAFSRSAIQGVVAGVTFTQFAMFHFGNLGVRDGTTAINLDGRIHGNGWVGVGASPLRARYLTSAQTVYTTQTVYGTYSPIYVGYNNTVGLSAANTRQIFATTESGCTNCAASGKDWPQWALDTFDGHVQDSAHGVKVLKPSIDGIPKVQNRLNLNVVTANQPERYLVDPVLASDTPGVKQNKFAYKADIRVVNGVWYLKDVSNENNWPGIPIWSDHPGSFTTTDEEGIEGVHNVGQDDIRTALALTSNAWGITLPQYFSYYKYDNVSSSIQNTTVGTVSYGNTHNATISGLSKEYPADYVNNNSLCKTVQTCVSCSISSPNLLRELNSPIPVCSVDGPVPLSTRLVNATRSGFRLGIIQNHWVIAGDRTGASKMFPQNFDLDQFTKAMACGGGSHPGELGCFFGPGKLIPRSFNGIVYLTNTWKGSMDGFAPGVAARRPPIAHGGADGLFLGVTADSSQAPVAHPAQQQSLPFELCSTSLVGQNLDHWGRFKIPDCATYSQLAPTPIRPRPDAIRILNGESIDQSVFPKGLSIVSNIPMFIRGSINSSSNTTSISALPWLPIFFSGDSTTPLSTFWSDDRARWDVTTSALARNAGDSTFNMATFNSQYNFFLNESWAGMNLKYSGPIVLGYRPVYWDMVGITVGAGTFTSPNYTVETDPHYQLVVNQPPGMPIMTMFATSVWVRK